MSSEITKCYIDIDSYKWIECEDMTLTEVAIYEYCLKQGAKNNMGIFSESRFDIARKLKADEAVTYLFFEKFPDSVAFCPETHLIWCKKFYGRIDLGLLNDVWETEQVKGGGQIKVKKQYVLNTKNKFITKLKQTLKTPVNSKSGDVAFLKDHWIIKEWVKKNKSILEMVNDDVKSVSGNNYSLDSVLSLAKE